MTQGQPDSGRLTVTVWRGVREPPRQCPEQTIDFVDASAYLRFSVTYLAKNEAEEDALMKETVERLGRLQLQF